MTAPPRAAKPPPRARTRARRTQGLSLIEVTLIVSVVAVALAALMPTFVRSLRVSKLSEASRELERLYQRSAAYYATAHPSELGLRVGCLPEAAGPAPAKPSVKPVLIKLAASDIPGAPTWSALGYEPEGAIRYRYTLLPSSAGCASGDAARGITLTLRAEGDLDGDGVLSLFERTARVISDELVPEPLLVTRDRTE